MTSPTDPTAALRTALDAWLHATPDDDQGTEEALTAAADDWLEYLANSQAGPSGPSTPPEAAAAKAGLGEAEGLDVERLARAMADGDPVIRGYMPEARRVAAEYRRLHPRPTDTADTEEGS